MTRPERPVCETWMDHEFEPKKIVASGRHPVRGPFQTKRQVCKRCGRAIDEIEWLNPTYTTAPMLGTERLS